MRLFFGACTQKLRQKPQSQTPPYSSLFKATKSQRITALFLCLVFVVETMLPPVLYYRQAHASDPVEPQALTVEKPGSQQDPATWRRLNPR